MPWAGWALQFVVLLFWTPLFFLLPHWSSSQTLLFYLDCGSGSLVPVVHLVCMPPLPFWTFSCFDFYPIVTLKVFISTLLHLYAVLHTGWWSAQFVAASSFYLRDDNHLSSLLAGYDCLYCALLYYLAFSYSFCLDLYLLCGWSCAICITCSLQTQQP